MKRQKPAKSEDIIYEWNYRVRGENKTPYDLELYFKKLFLK